MKTISLADAKAEALRTGARVSLGGKRFNSGGEVVNRQRAAAPAEVNVVHPPAPPAFDMEALARVLAESHERMASMIAGALKPPEPLPAPIDPVPEPQPTVVIVAPAQDNVVHLPKRWAFAVERSKSGVSKVVASCEGHASRTFDFMRNDSGHITEIKGEGDFAFTAGRDSAGHLVSLSR